ncbi:hypothetical protein P3S67_012610 [Capsicum chacoense]
MEKMSIKTTTYTISIILVLVIIQHAYGARHTQFFKVKPLPKNYNNKSPNESLPKGVPIPPSAPSKRHNGINLKRFWP